MPHGDRDRRVHLDTAGLGRMPVAARAELTEWTRHEDRHGPYEVDEHVHHVVRRELDVRLAALLGAPAGDTVLSTGAAGAFAALVPRLPLGPGDRIWTTPYEGVANLTLLTALRDRARCRLEVVPLRPDGDLDLEWMAAHIDDDVALVSVAHVPAGCGIVTPVEDIGRLLAPYRCLYAVDTSYAVGQLPVDAGRIGCQLLTGDGWRFLRGPESVGFAYAAPELRQALAPYGTGALAPPEGARVVALNAALAEQEDAVPAGDLAALLRTVVEETPGAELIAPGRVQSGIVTFRHAEVPAGPLRRQLAVRGVTAGKTVAQETPLYLPGRGVTAAVRVSVHHDNSAQDVDRFAEALRGALAGRGRHTVPVAVRAAAPARVAVAAGGGTVAAPVAAGLRAVSVPVAEEGAAPAVRVPRTRRRTTGRRHLALMSGPAPGGTA
ncbi:aminotransferase class V-fold PLP-dependent enzyme [Streptomyces sp. b94]|uniref:aminotransferase class V-fold PLP-dependent enzyme n=1 Tax=Streptomyces sp. b94 TaxID=1827634 RepID=UPI001FFD9754|nr:aminotransferase class V-fold PLP-dependent enzyme [Streptomyces sp. b94]